MPAAASAVPPRPAGLVPTALLPPQPKPPTRRLQAQEAGNEGAEGSLQRWGGALAHSMGAVPAGGSMALKTGERYRVSQGQQCSNKQSTGRPAVRLSYQRGQGIRGRWPSPAARCHRRTSTALPPKCRRARLCGAAAIYPRKRSTKRRKARARCHVVLAHRAEVRNGAPSTVSSTVSRRRNRDRSSSSEVTVT
jgi:hypothetical protein